MPLRSSALCALILAGWVLMVPARAVDLTLRIETFNIKNDNDSSPAGLQGVAATIQQSGADVIGLQETTATAVQTIANDLGYYYYNQSDGDEPGDAILSRYRIVDHTADDHGVLIELAPGHEAWMFNTHLDYKPYGPYQVNGIAYENGALYDPSTPQGVAGVIQDQVTARGSEINAVLQSIASTNAPANNQPVFLTGDFNEPSHLDWTPAAASANVHVAPIAWPTSQAVTAAGLQDSYRAIYPNPVANPGNTWSPLDPATYLDPGDNKAVQPNPLPEPQDRIDFVYYKGANVTPLSAQLSGPTGDAGSTLQLANYPSDHRSVTSTFQVANLEGTTLTFRALGSNGSVIPSNYGSHVLTTPDVAVQFSAGGGSPGDPPAWKFWDDSSWPGGVGYLRAGNGQQFNGNALFDVVLTPDQHFGVNVSSFQLLDYTDAGNSQGQLVGWKLLENGQPIASGTASVANNGTLMVNTGMTGYFTGTLDLRLTPLSGINNELGLDNLAFDQAPVAVGDVNGDGTVNGLDINLVATNWLHAGSSVQGDVNGDGVVNGLDINLIAANWLQIGAGTGVGIGQVTVPEPATFALALWGALMFVPRRRAAAQTC